IPIYRDSVKNKKSRWVHSVKNATRLKMINKDKTQTMLKEYLQKQGHANKVIPTYIMTQNQFAERCINYGTN
uniref:hypothetical protein n=1 Tax=Mariniflexile sp. TaxID=1979402 RepID=UPI0040486E0C